MASCCSFANSLWLGKFLSSDAASHSEDKMPHCTVHIVWVLTSDNGVQAWALAGIGVFGVLTALNCFWLYKLVQLALKLSPQPTAVADASQRTCTTAAAVELTAASGEAAVSVLSSSGSVSSSRVKAA